MKTTTISKKDLEKLSQELLRVLDERSRDVITQRFGLESGEGATLEHIGRQYNITRERVRQIEAHAKKTLNYHLGVLSPAAELLDNIFREHGGILHEARATELISQQLGTPILETLVVFYLEILPPYIYNPNDEHFMPHWHHPNHFPAHARDVIKMAREVLREAKAPLEEEKLIKTIVERLEAKSLDAPILHIYSWLLTSRDLKKNPYGFWGLSDWPEITPKGVGDKAYAVLRRHGKPEHFRKITELINQAKFDKKKSNPQTVHNELIKDERFVLVGRGMYALSEWGYMPGTVADVLETILRQVKGPLTKDELIERVLDERFVKKNTILLSLQNQARFVKIEKNRYTLREKSSKV